MSIMSLFKARREQAAGDALALARRLADGENVDLDRVETECFKAGYTLAQFEQLAELCRERKSLRTTAARLPAIEAERSAVGKKIAEANAVLQAAEEAYRKTMDSIRPLKDAVDGQYATASRAEASLSDDTMLPEPLVKQRKAAKARLFKASESLREVETKLDSAERALKRAKEQQAEQPRRNVRAEGDWQGPRDMEQDDRSRLAQKLHDLPIQIANLKEKLPPLRQEHAEAQKALSVVEKQCRDF